MLSTNGLRVIFLLTAAILFSASAAYAATQLNAATQASGGLQSGATQQIWSVIGESSTGSSSGPTTVLNAGFLHASGVLETIVGGNIATDTTWSLAGSPYIVTSDVKVVNNATLTIDPGTIVKFSSGTGLIIGGSFGFSGTILPGTLIAQGASAQPILFTTADPNPAPGQWNGISFQFQQTTDASILDYCVIEYGGVGTNNSNILVDSPPNPMIRHSTIRYSSGYGVLTDGTLTQCNIVNNALGGFKNTSSSPLNCYFNWWGNASGPSGAGPGTGDAIIGNVLFEPWLGAPFTTPFEWVEVRSSSSAITQAGGWTTFSGVLSEKGNWKITLKNSAGTVVKTFTGTGISISQDWFGDDTNKNPLPNGTYTYQLDAISISTGQAAAPAIGRIVLDNTLPIAKITSPTQNQMLAGGTTVNILGTAGGANFSSYKVEYGFGLSPSYWFQITSKTAPITNGLLASWNTTGLNSPIITLRLTTTTTDGKTAADLVTVQMLSLFNLTVSPTPFSPNGDGVLDTTALGATSTYPVNWTLNIKNNTGAVVKTFMGTGQTISQVWGGTDANGARVPDGVYNYQFQGLHVATGVSTTSTIGKVVVDVIPPTATITSPSEGQLFQVDNPISFIGTADDLNFQDYTLEYGVGSSPSSFTKLTTSLTKVVNSTLYTLDFHKLRSQQMEFPAGIYTFRLTVRDTAGNVSILDRHVNFDYLYISNISVNPFVIDPYKGESAIINYTLNRTADVTIRIYDDLTKNLIRTFALPGKPIGANTTSWDGKNSAGGIALEAYYFTIDATDTSGRKGTYNNATAPFLGPLRYLSNLKINSTNFNPYKNDLVRIDYDLDRIGRVNLRMSDAGFSTIRILLNQTIRMQGTNTELWDGRRDDGTLSQGTFNIDLFPGITTLPLNALILSHPLADFSNFRAEAYLIQPSYSEVSTLTYNLTQDAKVSITITDPNGNAVRILLSNVSQKVGPQKIEWDGRTDTGKLVSVEGDYTVTMTAVDPVSGLSSKRIGSILVYK